MDDALTPAKCLKMDCAEVLCDLYCENGFATDENVRGPELCVLRAHLTHLNCFVHLLTFSLLSLTRFFVSPSLLQGCETCRCATHGETTTPAATDGGPTQGPSSTTGRASASASVTAMPSTTTAQRGDCKEECSQGQVCLQGVCVADPCLEAECEQSELCVPQPVECFTTPCPPQYTCEAKEYCDQDPCEEEQQCVPLRIACVTTPCKQFVCVNEDVCDPNPCEEGEVCSASPEYCADCPPFMCTKGSGSTTTATATDAAVEDTTTTTTTNTCDGYTCPPPPPCPAPPVGCDYEPEYHCGCMIGCGKLVCHPGNEGDPCDAERDNACAEGLVCLQGVCVADPCLEAECEQSELCVPQPVECFTTPCPPQYTCEAKEYCDQDPCEEEQQCVPLRIACVTTPCKQFVCVNEDVCDPNPCEEGEVCSASPEYCADCPPFMCTKDSGSTTTATATDAPVEDTTTTTAAAAAATTTTAAEDVVPTIIVIGQMVVSVGGAELDLTLLRAEFLRHLRQTSGGARVIDVALRIVSRGRSSTDFTVEYEVHVASTSDADAVESSISDGSVFASLTTASASFEAAGTGSTSRQPFASSGDGSSSSSGSMAYIAAGVAAGAAVALVAVVLVFVRRSHKRATMTAPYTDRESFHNALYMNPSLVGNRNDGDVDV